MTEDEKKADEKHGRQQSAAYREKDKPGPDDDPVQVRPAGQKSTRDDRRKDWDEVDEASDESFPASDPSAKY